MIDEPTKEKLRTLTVEVLLEMRAAYLRTPSVNVLKHYDMIQDRMRMAARTTASAEEWVTAMSRSLRLDAPNSRFSEAALALANEVRERGCESDFLDLVEREHGFLMVMMRSVAEQRKAAGAAKEA